MLRSILCMPCLRQNVTNPIILSYKAESPIFKPGATPTMVYDEHCAQDSCMQLFVLTGVKIGRPYSGRCPGLRRLQADRVIV